MRGREKAAPSFQVQQPEIYLHCRRLPQSSKWGNQYSTFDPKKMASYPSAQTYRNVKTSLFNCQAEERPVLCPVSAVLPKQLFDDALCDAVLRTLRLSPPRNLEPIC